MNQLTCLVKIPSRHSTYDDPQLGRSHDNPALLWQSAHATSKASMQERYEANMLQSDGIRGCLEPLPRKGLILQGLRDQMHSLVLLFCQIRNLNQLSKAMQARLTDDCLVQEDYSSEMHRSGLQLQWLPRDSPRPGKAWQQRWTFLRKLKKSG